MNRDPDPYWIGIGIQPKMLELDPDPDEMNADPQPWYFSTLKMCTLYGVALPAQLLQIPHFFYTFGKKCKYDL